MLDKSKMLNCRELSKGCVKGFLIALNVICIVNAVGAFCFAVVDTNVLKQYGEEQAAGSLKGDLVIIAVSVMLAAIAILGCIGAVRDNVRMLNLYIICILVVVLLELLVAIFVSVQRYGLQYRVAEWLRDDFFSNSTGEALKEHDKLWDELQSSYSCCGLTGPQDYAAIGRPISVSCCDKVNRARTATAQAHLYRVCLDSGSYFSDGCEDEVIGVLQEDADWLFGVAVISFWFEAVSMLLAMWVANYVKNSVQVYKNTVKY